MMPQLLPLGFDGLAAQSTMPSVLRGSFLTKRFETSLYGPEDDTTLPVRKITYRSFAVIYGYGGRGRIRTRDSRLRRPVPYPG